MFSPNANTLTVYTDADLLDSKFTLLYMLTQIASKLRPLHIN